MADETIQASWAPGNRSTRNYTRSTARLLRFDSKDPARLKVPSGLRTGEALHSAHRPEFWSRRARRRGWGSVREGEGSPHPSRAGYGIFNNYSERL
jgi:hypothetical protein